MTRAWTDYDLGGAFAFIHAGAISTISLGLLVTHPGVLFTLWTPFFAGSSIAGWIGFWAWRRRRWLRAAAGFLFALAWPGGFMIVVTGPFVIGLFFVSLWRAWVDRSSRKRVVLDRVP